MRKAIVAVGACALLSGCALPVPIQVASWAVDVISMAATEKSLTDHGLSAIIDKDCALHRAVTEKDSVICREEDDSSGAVLVASADGRAPRAGLADPRSKEDITKFATIENSVASGSSPSGSERVSPEVLNAFETAAGPAVTTARGPERPVPVRMNLAHLPLTAENEGRPYIKFNEIRPVAQKAGTKQVADAAPAAALGNEPDPGFYYVIGSFRSPDRAKRHMRAHSQLQPAVLKGKIGKTGREVFRVVVGPFAADERKPARFRIKNAGVADTWAIRVKGTDWSVAARTMPVQRAASLGARDWPGLAALTTVEVARAGR